MNHKKVGAFIFIISILALAVVLILWQQKTKKLNYETKSGVGRYLQLKDKKINLPKLTTTDGQSLSLSDFKNKEVLINFWASWCAPCVEEFPSFVKLLQKQKGNIIILAISRDKAKEDISKFLKTFNLEKTDLEIYFIWDEDKTLSDYFGTVLLPETYLLDRSHLLRRKIIGITDWSEYIPAPL